MFRVVALTLGPSPTKVRKVIATGFPDRDYALDYIYNEMKLGDGWKSPYCRRHDLPSTKTTCNIDDGRDCVIVEQRKWMASGIGVVTIDERW